jgi:hypothetical protein
MMPARNGESFHSQNNRPIVDGQNAMGKQGALVVAGIETTSYDFCSCGYNFPTISSSENAKSLGL